MPMPFQPQVAGSMAGQQQMSPAGQLGGLQQAGFAGQSMGQASPAVQQQLAQMRLQGPQSMGQMPQQAGGMGGGPAAAGRIGAPMWGQAQAPMWGMGGSPQSQGPQAGQMQQQRPNPMMPAMLRGGPMRSTR